MKSGYIFFLFFFIFGTLFAQSTSSSDATVLLNTTAQRYNVLSAFSFKFSVLADDPTVKMPKITGTLHVKKEKYLLTIDDQIIANDGITLWNYQKSTNEASLFEAADDDFSMFHPLKILNNWSKDYNAKVIREENINNKKVTLVDLTPKKQLTFYKIRLYIADATYYVQKIMIYQIEAPNMIYAITKFTSNDPVEDSKFTFNKKDYPNVQVNDMR